MKLIYPLHTRATIPTQLIAMICMSCQQKQDHHPAYPPC